MDNIFFYYELSSVEQNELDTVTFYSDVPKPAFYIIFVNRLNRVAVVHNYTIPGEC